MSADLQTNVNFKDKYLHILSCS